MPMLGFESAFLASTSSPYPKPEPLSFVATSQYWFLPHPNKPYLPFLAFICCFHFYPSFFLSFPPIIQIHFISLLIRYSYLHSSNTIGKLLLHTQSYTPGLLLTLYQDCYIKSSTPVTVVRPTCHLLGEIQLLSRPNDRLTVHLSHYSLSLCD